MAFRQQMQVSVSQAELDLRIDIKRSELGQFLLPSDLVVIFTKPLTILHPEFVTKAMLQRGSQRLPFTKPDFLFCDSWHRPLGQVVPVYLDGPPHEKLGVMDRDDRIDSLWRQYGVEPLRFRYTPPLSEKRKTEIFEAIREALKFG